MNESNFVHTSRVLIVEGKYDAARLSHLTDAMILLTDGFAIYKDKKRQQLFKALAKKNGLILLTDSDAAGFRIRNYITNLVGARNVVQAYVPAIHGKEKRKPQPGKEGLLGVEGVDDAILCEIFRKFLEKHPDCGTILPCDSDPAADSVDPAEPVEKSAPITKTDLYFWQLTGQDNAAARRNAFCKRAGLPMDMTPNAFLAAVNILYTKDEAEALLRTLD